MKFVRCAQWWNKNMQLRSNHASALRSAPVFAKRTLRSLTCATLTLATLTLGGCASEGGLIHKAAIGVGFGTEAPKPKEFVTETRPSEPQFVPVGTSISRPVQKKTVSEFKTMEAELDNRLNTDRASGVTAKQLGSTPPPAPPKIN
jgi:hypothetical protein